MPQVTRRQEKRKKGRIKAKLREYKISLKSIEDRSGELRPDGKKFHRNTVWSAFNTYHDYYNSELISLADKMIYEKKELASKKQ